jgi:hypothetical protein
VLIVYPLVIGAVMPPGTRIPVAVALYGLAGVYVWASRRNKANDE